MRRLSMHLLAILAAIGIVVAVGGGWLLYLRVRAPIDGSPSEPLTVSVPVALVALTVIWLLARALLWRVQWSLLVLLTASALFAYAVVAAFCGPVACFVPGPQRFAGWFVVVGVAVAALAHHLIAQRLRFL